MAMKAVLAVALLVLVDRGRANEPLPGVYTASVVVEEHTNGSADHIGTAGSTEIPEDELVDVTEHNIVVGRTCVTTLCSAACKRANHVAARCHNGGCQCRDRRPRRHKSAEGRAVSEDNINVNYNVNNLFPVSGPAPAPYMFASGVGGGAPFYPMYPGVLAGSPGGYPVPQQPWPYSQYAPQPGSYPLPGGYPQPMAGGYPQQVPVGAGYPPQLPGVMSFLPPAGNNGSAQPYAFSPVQQPGGGPGGVASPLAPQSPGSPPGSSGGGGGLSPPGSGGMYPVVPTEMPRWWTRHVTSSESTEGDVPEPPQQGFMGLLDRHGAGNLHAVPGAPALRRPLTMGRPEHGQPGLPGFVPGLGQYPWPLQYSRGPPAQPSQLNQPGQQR